MMKNNCACGSALPYHACCSSLHLGHAVAACAENLMRSRYCAFVHHKIDYLVLTHSIDTRDSISFADIKSWNDSCQWLALNVVNVISADKETSVEFVAWYKQDGHLKFHHELSTFKKQSLDRDFKHFLQINEPATQVWFYHSANYPTSTVTLPKRNDHCICGSGQKFKKCCAK